MSRYTFKLDTQKRTYEVTDTETGSVLQINQETSNNYLANLSEDDTDRLVEFANDFQDDLANGQLALELKSSLNVLIFKDNDFPHLSGGVALRNCVISSPNLINVDLWNVNILKSERTVITQSTIEGLSWDSHVSVTISHCFVNEKYNTILERISEDRNEWFMNQRVDNEMW